MSARISRQYLSDDSLDRARQMILAQLSTLGTLRHRYREDPEVEYALGRDENALSDVLGILLIEQRERRYEDADAALPAEGATPAEGPA